MAKNKIYTVKFRRKRERKTDYKKRLKYIASGNPRIVIRSSNNNIKIQAIKFNETGDVVLNTINSTDLKKFGWKLPMGNIPSAYLTGLLFGNKIKSEISGGVIDVGLKSIRKNTKLSAVIAGIIDSGVKVPCNSEIFPSPERLNGTLISEYSKKLKELDEKKQKLQFSKYLKINVDPEELPVLFEKMKKKLTEA